MTPLEALADKWVKLAEYDETKADVVEARGNYSHAARQWRYRATAYRDCAAELRAAITSLRQDEP